VQLGLGHAPEQLGQALGSNGFDFSHGDFIAGFDCAIGAELVPLIHDFKVTIVMSE
jgi:hypothetical protein